MYYLEKYQSLVDSNDSFFEDNQLDLCVPHQAFTPRQILQQFVMNDVQVQIHQPTDNISINDLNEIMDHEDFANIQSHLQDFEDEFEAREATRERFVYKRPRKPNKQIEDNPEDLPDKTTPPEAE